MLTRVQSWQEYSQKMQLLGTEKASSNRVMLRRRMPQEAGLVLDGGVPPYADPGRHAESGVGIRTRFPGSAPAPLSVLEWPRKLELGAYYGWEMHALMYLDSPPKH